MAKQHSENCGQCAYAQKEDCEIWCPFLDEQVSEKLVCDYFLDEYQSPLYESLVEGNSKPSIGVIIKDIIGYGLIAGMILFSIICTHGILTQ